MTPFTSASEALRCLASGPLGGPSFIFMHWTSPSSSGLIIPQASLCLECAFWVPCTHTPHPSVLGSGATPPGSLLPSPRSVWGLLESLSFAPCHFTSSCLTATVLQEGRARVSFPQYPGHTLRPKWGGLAQGGLQEMLGEGKESRKLIRTKALTDNVFKGWSRGYSDKCKGACLSWKSFDSWHIS